MDKITISQISASMCQSSSFFLMFKYPRFANFLMFLCQSLCFSFLSERNQGDKEDHLFQRYQQWHQGDQCVL